MKTEKLGTSELISDHLLEVLVCPLCKCALSLNQGKDWLHCPHCKGSYPVDHGIPVLLVSELKSEPK